VGDDPRGGGGGAVGLGCGEARHRTRREGQGDRGGSDSRRRGRRGTADSHSIGADQGMKWVSSRGNSPAVPFIDALFAGTAPDGGLYMPERLEPLSPAQLDSIRAADGDIVKIGTIVGAHLLRDEISGSDLRSLVRAALDFPIPVVQVTDDAWALELFHGPTMAFKDVGARM